MSLSSPRGQRATRWLLLCAHQLIRNPNTAKGNVRGWTATEAFLSKPSENLSDEFGLSGGVEDFRRDAKSGGCLTNKQKK